ncbi:MAG: LPXTG cell wall anchor domain-containing protein [Acidimicrobiales bacterium]
MSAASASAPADLPTTGHDPSTLVVAAGALVLIGVLARRTARRQQLAGAGRERS